MLPSGGGELSNEQDLVELEDQIEAFADQKKQCEQEIHQLRLQEDPEQGIFFAQEIFSKQQEKLRLQVELNLCRAKKNRYLLAKSED